MLDAGAPVGGEDRVEDSPTRAAGGQPRAASEQIGDSWRKRPGLPSWKPLFWPLSNRFHTASILGGFGNLHELPSPVLVIGVWAIRLEQGKREDWRGRWLPAAKPGLRRRREVLTFDSAAADVGTGLRLSPSYQGRTPARSCAAQRRPQATAACRLQ